MQANLVTLIRSLMVFVVIGLYGVSTIASGVALVLTIVVLYMDALDGIIARKLVISSVLGLLRFHRSGELLGSHDRDREKLLCRLAPHDGVRR